MTNPVADVAREAGENSSEKIRDREISDPDPDLTTDPTDDVDDVEPEPEGVVDRLFEPMQGDPLADNLREIWSPEEGGLNRITGVLKEVGGVDELPRVAHLAIGVGETYSNHADGLDLSRFSRGSDESDDETTLSRDILQ